MKCTRKRRSVATHVLTPNWADCVTFMTYTLHGWSIPASVTATIRRVGSPLRRSMFMLMQRHSWTPAEYRTIVNAIPV